MAQKRHLLWEFIIFSFKLCGYINFITNKSKFSSRCRQSLEKRILLKRHLLSRFLIHIHYFCIGIQNIKKSHKNKWVVIPMGKIHYEKCDILITWPNVFLWKSATSRPIEKMSQVCDICKILRPRRIVWEALV